MTGKQSSLYDVLILGGGNAALCAAITAQEAGSRVLTLESSPKEFRGGNMGMFLLILNQTTAMGIMLVLHLGLVLAFFITIPYGKFVHGIYSHTALVRYAQEQSEATE